MNLLDDFGIKRHEKDANQLRYIKVALKETY